MVLEGFTPRLRTKEEVTILAVVQERKLRMEEIVIRTFTCWQAGMQSSGAIRAISANI